MSNLQLLFYCPSIRGSQIFPSRSGAFPLRLIFHQARQKCHCENAHQPVRISSFSVISGVWSANVRIHGSPGKFHALVPWSHAALSLRAVPSRIPPMLFLTFRLVPVAFCQSGKNLLILPVGFVRCDTFKPCLIKVSIAYPPLPPSQ